MLFNSAIFIALFLPITLFGLFLLANLGFSWVLFRASNFEDAIILLQTMVGINGIILQGRFESILSWLMPLGVQFGSSRTLTGINPDSPALRQYQAVYNLGISGGNIYEQRRYLEYAIVHQPDLEMVILGIDLWTIADPYKGKHDILRL